VINVLLQTTIGPNAEDAILEGRSAVSDVKFNRAIGGVARCTFRPSMEQRMVDDAG
jgi:hypothetical protein